MLLLIFCFSLSLLEATQYYTSSPYLPPEKFPANTGLSEGLAKAHASEVYNVEGCFQVSERSLLFSLYLRPQILFVAQPGERNVLINI